MSIVFDHVLQTTDDKRFTRKHKNTPRKIWKFHELHQHSLAINKTITTALSQDLAKMKISNFDALHNALMHLTPNLRHLIKHLLLIYLLQLPSVS